MERTDRKAAAFLLPPGAAVLSPRTARLSTQRSQPRPTSSFSTPEMASSRPPPKRVGWLRVALLAAGTALGGGVRPSRNMLDPSSSTSTNLLSFTPPPSQAASASAATGQRLEKGPTSNVISLRELGVKKEDFLSDRELRRRKTTQFSEAEEEIMELEEWEVATQWFRDLQLMWAGIASVAGMFVLYKGGVLWENWIREQERKDMEEEIELTGTFIDPRAVRKDEDDDTQIPKTVPKKPDSDPNQGGESGGDDNPPGNLEALERIFGKS